jgi:hypothetical protein
MKFLYSVRQKHAFIAEVKVKLGQHTKVETVHRIFFSLDAFVLRAMLDTSST